MRDELIKAVESMVDEELQSSMEKLFNSTHEGYAVILKEVDELKDEIEGKDRINESIEWLWRCVKNNSKYTKNSIKQIENAAINAACEAIQVAAMCKKFAKSIDENWRD